MVDIVINHNGWPGPHESVDFSVFNPFNQPSDYNLPYCAIDYSNLTENVSVDGQSVRHSSLGLNRLQSFTNPSLTVSPWV
jgi:alpha-amylase